MVLDLTETEDCSARARQYQPPVEEKVQVLMVEGKRQIQGQLCRVLQSKIVSVCDQIIHHIFGTQFTVWRQLVELTVTECLEMARMGVYWFDDHKIKVEQGVLHSRGYFTKGLTDGYK